MKGLGKIPIALAGIVALVALYLAVRPKPTLADLAERYVRQTYAGEPSMFLDGIPPHELQGLGWSREDARRFYDRWLYPRLRKYRLEGITSKHLQAEGASAYCTFRVRLPSGRVVDRGISVIYGERGQAVRGAQIAVQEVWELDHLTSGGSTSTVDMVKMIRASLVRDAVGLKALGYTRVMRDDEPEHPGTSIDEYIARFAAQQHAATGGDQR